MRTGENSSAYANLSRRRYYRGGVSDDWKLQIRTVACQVPIDLPAPPVISYRYNHIVNVLIGANANGIVQSAEHQITSPNRSSRQSVIEVTGDTIPAC